MKAALESVKPQIEQKIQLVDGEFTVSEASDVVLSLLNEKINFHKLQRLSMCEGSVDANTKYPDGRIAELEREKSVARNFFAKAREEGNTIVINGTLEISVK